MHRLENHLLMSVSKVFAGVVVAILEDRGLVDSTLGIETYIPEVRESGWEGVSVRDVLDMASGIDCDEMAPDAYSDPAAKYYRFEASLGLLPPAVDDGISTYDYIASLGRARTPGEAYEYNSINTFMLSWVAESVTGKGFADILTDEIWSKIGAEGDALISSSRSGATAPHGGMIVRLRDLARFGLLYTPSWPVVSATPLISERHLHEILHGGRPEIFARGNRYTQGQLERLAPAVPLFNSYQWDFVMPDGGFFKGGMGGQGLYISPHKNLVFASTASSATTAKRTR
jgi:CubicO group peptidase (beta-lactamase class C family)